MNDYTDSNTTPSIGANIYKNVLGNYLIFAYNKPCHQYSEKELGAYYDYKHANGFSSVKVYQSFEKPVLLEINHHDTILYCANSKRVLFRTRNRQLIGTPDKCRVYSFN